MGLEQWCYLAGALVLSGHHGASLPDGHLKVLQDRGERWVGPPRPLQALLDARLQCRQLLLRTQSKCILVFSKNNPTIKKGFPFYPNYNHWQQVPTIAHNVNTCFIVWHFLKVIKAPVWDHL